MNMTKENLSLIPSKIKDKDPRALMYHFPNMPKIKFVKLMTEYFFYRSLQSVEETANKMGYILVPLDCLTWKRAKDYGDDRKVKVIGRSFFLMKPNELTKREKEKLLDYIEDHMSA